MFRPGRARLATRPWPTGSPTPVKTIGIVAVAFLAASDAGVPLVRIKLTRSPTSSAARSGNRSSRPSADRYSMPRFSPSTYPRSRNPCRKAVTLAALTSGDVRSSMPMR